MTPEAQRIAIAEACGWPMGIEIPPGTATIYQIPPSFRIDLNVMHEAENTLNREQQAEFLGQLALADYGNLHDYQWGAVHATADHRAEAFLRTIGKWDDSK